jgi:UDP-N-acetylmuramoyl-tripeptide--D-alanyl-D-alanine ligase
MAQAAIAAGLEPSSVSSFDVSSAAADAILPWLRTGDLILVKGSRGIQTDVVVDRIMAELA